MLLRLGRGGARAGGGRWTIVVVDPVLSSSDVAADIVRVEGTVAHLCVGEGGERRSGRASEGSEDTKLALSSWCVLCIVGCACFNWEL